MMGWIYCCSYCPHKEPVYVLALPSVTLLGYDLRTCDVLYVDSGQDMVFP